jgi:hypothetical protein
VDHENIYLVNWVAEALEHFEAAQSQSHLQKARGRLTAADSISEVFPEMERDVGI